MSSKSQKDPFWFRHDAGARNDPKIMRLLRVSGLAGYGLFWSILELLRVEENHHITIGMIPDLCFALNCTESDFEVLFDCGLLEKEENSFFSASLIRRMDKYHEKTEKLRVNGSKGGKAKAKQMPSKNIAIAKQNPSKHVAMGLDGMGLEGTGKEIKKEYLFARSDCDSQLLQAGAKQPIIDAIREKYSERLESVSEKTIINLIVELSGTLFPSVDVPTEIRKAAQWEVISPDKKKTPKGIPRFLIGWMTREQNKPRPYNQQPPRQAESAKPEYVPGYISRPHPSLLKKENQQ